MNNNIDILFDCLIEINQWESYSLPIASTVIGRHVYFCIAKDLLLRKHRESDRSLKQVLAHPNFTDRAIRLKLREMEEQGWLQMSSNEIDKRAKLIEPTQKLLNAIEAHDEALRQIIGKKFILLEK